MVDYKRLLWKNINHVDKCEGSDFLPVEASFDSDGQQNVSGVAFTEEKAAALNELPALEPPATTSRPTAPTLSNALKPSER